MTQGNILDDPDLEDRIRDRGASIATTEAAVTKAAKKLADPEAAAWAEDALAALRAVATRQGTLTGDDVWQQLGTVDERFGSQMGVVFRRAKREKLIAPTGGFVESQRASRHRSGIRIWQSLIQASS